MGARLCRCAERSFFLVVLSHVAARCLLLHRYHHLSASLRVVVHVSYHTVHGIRFRLNLRHLISIFHTLEYRWPIGDLAQLSLQ